ncbi:MAG: homoserine O-acetyltransferase [Alphaproteobacteria bacterium]
MKRPDPTFESSDAVRSARPLRHARSVRLPGPVDLELGGRLADVEVACETWGTLSPAGDNVVLVCHALSGDSHAARHDADDDPGWWEILVGPGKPIDTDRLFVVCQNVLGGCRGTTGPSSVDPATGRPYGADFPAITIGDRVEVQRRTLLALGIERLRAVVGGSLGGQQAMTWAVRHPDRVGGCVVVASSARLTSQAIAFDVVGRNAIVHDPGFRDGQYYAQESGPAVGLALARMLAHITYLSRDAMTAKFDPGRTEPRDIPTAFEKRFSVGSYLAWQGDKFVERFDANSYVTLTLAMDFFDLGDDPGELRRALERSPARWLVLAFESDWLFPPEQSRKIVDARIASGRPVSWCCVESGGGHDSFLLEEKLDVYGGMIGGFLASVDESARPAASVDDGEDGASRPDGPTPRRAVFRGQRLDQAAILRMIPPGESVLDLGCGDGELLRELRRRGNTGLGIELDERHVLATIRDGHDVVQQDLERGLCPFRDGQFDWVVLSQTLQSVTETELIVREMVRVGRRAIASFPNFAWHRLRTMLFEQGRSPKAEGAYGYEWWNTPNRRFPSILDFEEFCRRQEIAIDQRVYLDSESGRLVAPDQDPNWNADVAIFVIRRGY